MNARETLVTTLTNLLARTRNGRMDEHRAEAERMVEEALKERAHELAEEGRTLMGPRSYPHESERVTRYVAGWHDALNHIDPEDPRCVGCGSPRDDGQAHGYGAGYGGCV
ncbi:hypothetical protein [Streptomyces canus]|uniref:hypothetical protein n=1 Tax=Streptomyces canus TaxID=58343 RepID=UPI00386D78C0|nr:hypothetical protein OH824_34835 [Streptomyces canus]